MIILLSCLCAALLWHTKRKDSPENPASEDSSAIKLPNQITVIFPKEMDENTSQELADMYLSKRAFWYAGQGGWENAPIQGADPKETTFVRDEEVNWEALKSIDV